MSNLNTVIRTEFAAAINQIANERKIPAESIYDAIRQALVSAYRKQVGQLKDDFYYFVKLDEDTGESRIFEAPVLKRNEETLEILEWDESKAQDVTPAGFGRIAAQTAKQVILQKIRQSERDQVLADYQDKIGELVTAQVLRMDKRTVVMDIGRGQGYMPPEEQMRGEFYRANQRLAVLIKEIQESERGRRVIVSRADAKLVIKLFEREVPEVAAGSVKINQIAREAGVRTKLTVRSTQEGVDPVGSCVGQKGVRVQKVIEELNNEKIDIIPFNDNITILLQGALAPAENLTIEIKEKQKKVIVTAPDDQLSLAIGKGGQNVRLAAKLTGYQITIQSKSGDVKSAATGEEKYEIDSIKGLSDEAKLILVEHKLTTFDDLTRFKEKWTAMKELAMDQKEILEKYMSKYLAALEEKKENAAVDIKATAEEKPLTSEKITVKENKE